MSLYTSIRAQLYCFLLLLFWLKVLWFRDLSLCNTTTSVRSEWQIDLLKYHSFPLRMYIVFKRQTNSTWLWHVLCLSLQVEMVWKKKNNSNNLLVFNLCSTHFEYKLKIIVCTSAKQWVLFRGFVLIPEKIPFFTHDCFMIMFKAKFSFFFLFYSMYKYNDNK